MILGIYIILFYKTIFSRIYSQEQFPLLVTNKLSSPKESVSKLPFLPQRHEDTKKKVLKITIFVTRMLQTVFY